MNLYEFSQVDNHEMGVLVVREEEPQLYDEINQESRRIIRTSEEIRVTVARVDTAKTSECASRGKRPKKRPSRRRSDSGFCIRCQETLPAGTQRRRTANVATGVGTVEEQRPQREALPPLRQRPSGDARQARLSQVLPKAQDGLDLPRRSGLNQRSRATRPAGSAAEQAPARRHRVNQGGLPRTMTRTPGNSTPNSRSGAVSENPQCGVVDKSLRWIPSSSNRTGRAELMASIRHAEDSDQPRPVSLNRPFRTGIYFGAGLIMTAGVGWLCLVVLLALLNAILP